jgi:hypothetical protein
MKKANDNLTIGIAAGLFTATLGGLGIASYIKSGRRRSNRISAFDNAEINAPPKCGGYSSIYQK